CPWPPKARRNTWLRNSKPSVNQLAATKVTSCPSGAGGCAYSDRRWGWACARGKSMRQFTIAERLAAAVLLPLVALLLVPLLTAALMPYLDAANTTYAEIFFGLVTVSVAGAIVLVMARGIVRPIRQVADTLDAIAYAELESAAPLQPTRGEIERLLAATDRLADVIGERQRRELVHNDLDRAWQASRRVNL